MTTFSVVIPYRNKTIDQLHDAVMSAFYDDVREIIVVDDYSDVPLGISLSPRVRLLKNFGFHAGVCYARNYAIDHAKGDVIIPLDADETFVEGGLQALIDAYEPGYFVYGNWLEDGEVRKPAPFGMIGRKNVACATFLFEKSAWAQVGGYNPRYEIGGEDWAFMCALAEAGIKPRYVDATIHTYTRTPNGRAARMLPYVQTIRDMLHQDYPKVTT